ncbi:integrase catalytic domain-containing protein [Trichonephila clavipes]|nr:integrase catalytic domain-containing protein [Trichonephila clavipes]
MGAVQCSGNDITETNSLPETSDAAGGTASAEDQYSISDQAWDEYQDPPYLSEPYSEQTVDEDEVRKLISFGDDYRATLGSYSDASSVSIRLPHPKHRVKTRSSVAKGEDVSSDSDSEDFHHILETSSRAFQFVSNSIKENTTKMSFLSSEFKRSAKWGSCEMKFLTLDRIYSELKDCDDIILKNIKKDEEFEKEYNKIEEYREKMDLVRCMVQGSPACEVIESFPPTSENYEKAIEALKNRFGREEFWIEFYVCELLALVIQNAIEKRGKSSISYLYVKLESHLRSLESIGLTSEKYEAILFLLVESCIPEESMRVWLRNPTQSSAENELTGGYRSKLKNLLCFLKHEVEDIECLQLAKNGMKFEINNGNLKNKKNKNLYERVPTASNLFSGDMTRRQLHCVFYDKSHEILKSWEDELIIEEVFEGGREGRCHYLPHHGVYKECSTMQLRPVFDAACKGKGKFSLNDYIEKGLNLLDTIPSIFMRFREKKIGIISDIKKAFLQISIHLKDRFLKIFLMEGL